MHYDLLLSADFCVVLVSHFLCVSVVVVFVYLLVFVGASCMMGYLFFSLKMCVGCVVVARAT